MDKETKRILLVISHNAFREALAVRLKQEEDLEVAWQAGSIADTQNVHLNGIDVTLVDPLLPDGDGLELIREMSVANPKASSVLLCHDNDPALYHQALEASATEVLVTSKGLEEAIDAVKRSAAAA